MTQMGDTLEKIRTAAKELSIAISGILDNFRQNEEYLTSSLNKREQLESQLDQLNLQEAASGNEKAPGHNMLVEDGNLIQNNRTVPLLLQQFQEAVSKKLALLTDAVEQLASGNLIPTWKHEKQRSIGGVNMTRTITLEQLQLWCVPIADRIWELYQHLQEARRILQNGITQSGNGDDLHFVETSTDDVVQLIQRLLSNCFVVEEQPQIIYSKAKSTKRFVASLLTGSSFDIHKEREPPAVRATLIDEERARSLSVADNIEAVGDVANGVVPMEYREESNKLIATFDTMWIRKVQRKNGDFKKSPLMRGKHCLHFSFTLTFGARTVRVSTTSLSVIVFSKRKLEDFASGIIRWYNAFAQVWREPFDVPETAKWSEIAQILRAKYREATEGHELTEDNLAYLARKAYGNVQPQPETISFDNLCNDKQDQDHPFSFWTWFHSILKFIVEAHLQEMCRAGLIMGFIDRKSAETLVASRGEPGTFLLRFSGSCPHGGVISIVCAYPDGGQASWSPFRALDLRAHTLAERLREMKRFKWLYQNGEWISKDDAFGQFYEATEPLGPFVPILGSIPPLFNVNWN